MCAVDFSQETDRQTPVVREQVPAAPNSPGNLELVKVEANLLRLPLFALHTKGLKTLDGLECRGRVCRDGQSHQFTFRATRNTATAYPGPLSRSAHLALLSIITERGLPHRDPLTWSWRDLCRRMGVTYGGQMVRHLKDAITSTAALLLQSEHAVYDKPAGRLLTTQQEALHLYDRVAFVGTQLPDGRTADGNYLWLADWYRENLNAFFTAPLDYALWRHLDVHSPIASRLYEFLLLNFYSGAPVLRIKYETLVQFLPIKAERYQSSAVRQLEAAFRLLGDCRIIARAEWGEATKGIGQLHLYRGERLPGAGRSAIGLLASNDEESVGTVAVKELRNLKPPDWNLVTDFYRLWNGGTARPTPKELSLARDLIAVNGPVKAKRLIPLVVKKLKIEWPDAKTFGALVKYLPDVSQEYERRERVADREKQERLRQEHELENERNERQAQEQRLSRWRPVWRALLESDRERVEAAVRSKWPHIARLPEMFERFCILELAREKESSPASERSSMSRQ